MEPQHDAAGCPRTGCRGRHKKLLPTSFLNSFGGMGRGLQRWR